MELKSDDFPDDDVVFVTLGDGTEAVAKAHSWIVKHTSIRTLGHFHSICVVRRSLWQTSRIPEQDWGSSSLGTPLIVNSDGCTVCFYCALAQVAPEITFDKIQNIYLEAKAVAKAQGYDEDAVWIPMAQKFYDDMSDCCPLKPAKC